MIKFMSIGLSLGLLASSGAIAIDTDTTQEETELVHYTRIASGKHPEYPNLTSEAQRELSGFLTVQNFSGFKAHLAQLKEMPAEKELSADVCNLIASGKHPAYPNLSEGFKRELDIRLTLQGPAGFKARLAQLKEMPAEEDLSAEVCNLIASGKHPAYPNLPEEFRLELYSRLTLQGPAGFKAHLAATQVSQ